MSEPVEMGLVGVIGAAVTFVGWLCWTGRWRSWGRRGGLFDPVMPMLLFWGGGLTLFVGGLVVIGLLGGDPGGAAGGAVVLVGGMAMAWGVIGTLATLFPRATYERKPNGSWLTRLFLPPWYHEYLRETFGTDRSGR